MEAKFDSELKIWKGPSVPYPFPMDKMISDLVFENLSKTTERILQITKSDDKAITCNELKISIIRVAQNLAKIDIKEDDVVGIIARQSHLSTYIIHGCIALGALINPLHAAMSEFDIRGIFTQTRPKIIICQSDVIPKVQRALENVDFDFRIYSTSNDDSDLPNANELIKSTGIEDAFELPKFKKPANEKIYAILCSSGTTGMPKGVCLTHWSVLSIIPTNLKKTQQSVTYTASPIYWSSGFTPIISSVLSSNELRIVREDKPFDTKEFFEDVEKYGITAATLTPTVLALVLNDENLSKYNLNSLQVIFSAGSIISKTVRDKFSKTFPDKQLLTAYGMTEMFATMTKPNEYKKEYAVGSILLPNIEIKIVDDNGKKLGINEIGEICIKSPIKFIGYYNNPKATEEAFDEEGFFKSGDIGYFDDEGMLYCVDRKKEILKVKGHQVNPSEIENIIQEIEGVQQVSVVGIPNDFVGHLLTAAVVKKKGYESLKEEEIIKHVANSLPEYKHLDGGVCFFEKLPMTPSDKIQKRYILQDILNIKNNSVIKT